MGKSIIVSTLMIAPCGMNCALCMAHHRDRDVCLGCMATDSKKAAHCGNCIIRNCRELKNSRKKYCFACTKYPCTRLKNLDKRYRTKYGMSMIENLNSIKEAGIRNFVKNEKKRWACAKCGSTICVHRDKCVVCGAEWKDKISI